MADERNLQVLKKPSWMKLDLWRQFVDARGPFCCAVCGETEPLLQSVDHIVPRAKGGTDDLTNLQWLCVPHNSAKNSRPDVYWSQNFYFDGPHDISRFRASQRDYAYEQIVHHQEWFSRPWSQISGHLYLLAWVVGGGKTMAIPALAFALNRVVLMRGVRGSSRADKILVVCKEQAIRDQLAASLRDDITAFGIAGSAPRVGTIRKGEQWQDREALKQKDIWVACIQQLWEHDGGRPRSDLGEILAQFPLVIIDEPHFAPEQVMGLVAAGPQSLFFGLTGTPIKASGDVLTRMILFSVYGWQDADANDGSMKFLSEDETERREIVQVVGIDEAEIMELGKVTTTESTEHPHYAKQIVPAMTVMEEVIRYVHDCDREHKDGAKFAAAKHRGNARASFVYPEHAMIHADTIQAGKQLVEAANKIFDMDRRKYPVEQGYRAGLVCSGDERDRSDKVKPIALTPSHPWLLAKHNGGALQTRDGQTAIRFLVVVGIGREGVDNPLCGVVGVACKSVSIVEHIQRTFGRQLRAYTRRGTLGIEFPPRRLDTVKVITHAAFGAETIGGIIDALSWILNMPERLRPLRTMSDLIEGNLSAPDGEISEAGDLSLREKLEAAHYVGDYAAIGESVDPAHISEMVDRGAGPSKREKLSEWVRTVSENPTEANRRLEHSAALSQIPIVMRELPSTDPTLEDLIRYTKSYARLAQFAPRLDQSPEALAFCRHAYEEHVQRFHVGSLTKLTDIDRIRKDLAGEILRGLAGVYRGDHGVVFPLVGAAVKTILGVPRNEAAAVESKWDSPQCHVILFRPEVRRQIGGYVRYNMMRRGFLPSLAQAFGVEEDSLAASEAS